MVAYCSFDLIVSKDLFERNEEDHGQRRWRTGYEPGNGENGLSFRLAKKRKKTVNSKSQVPTIATDNAMMAWHGMKVCNNSAE